MPVQRAIAAYRTEGLNCAQSILRAFQEECDIPEETVREARRFGGGRALEGRCGALHAACELSGDEAARDRLPQGVCRKGHVGALPRDPQEQRVQLRAVHRTRGRVAEQRLR